MSRPKGEESQSSRIQSVSQFRVFTLDRLFKVTQDLEATTLIQNSPRRIATISQMAVVSDKLIVNESVFLCNKDRVPSILEEQTNRERTWMSAVEIVFKDDDDIRTCIDMRWSIKQCREKMTLYRLLTTLRLN